MLHPHGPFTPGLPVPTPALEDLCTPRSTTDEKRELYQSRGKGRGKPPSSITLDLDPEMDHDGAGNGMQKEGNGRPPSPPDTCPRSPSNQVQPPSSPVKETKEDSPPASPRAAGNLGDKQRSAQPEGVKEENPRSIYEDGTYWRFLS